MRRCLVPIFLALLGAGLRAQSPAPARFGDDISGLYAFFRDGESIQLTVQHGSLEGWVHTYGFLDSDRDVEVDRFFEKSSLEGDQIYFITKPLHGCWVEFKGRIERGEGRTRELEGYYRLVGHVTEYITDADHRQTTQQRDVVFKSQAQALAATR